MSFEYPEEVVHDLFDKSRRAINKEQLVALFKHALHAYDTQSEQAWSEFCKLYNTLYNQLDK